MNIELTKINESFTEISGDRETLLKIYNHLKCEEPPTYSRFGGFSTTYRYFAKTQGQKLIIPNGLLSFLSSFNIIPEPDISEFSELEIKSSLDEIIKLMPFEPYDYQYRCALESLLNPKQINLAATGAGKSAIIFLIIMFLYKHNKKGLLIVPNINLLTQLKQDFHDYFKNPEGNLEFLNSIETLGGGTVATFNKFLVISTWQSLNNNTSVLNSSDFIICDECLHPNTLITTKRGDIKISDLTLDDIVLTINEESKELEYNSLVKIHKNISTEKMFKIVLEDGKEIKITGNHKIFTNRGWVRVDELLISDDIITL